MKRLLSDFICLVFSPNAPDEFVYSWKVIIPFYTILILLSCVFIALK